MRAKTVRSRALSPLTEDRYVPVAGWRMQHPREPGNTP